MTYSPPLSQEEINALKDLIDQFSTPLLLKISKEEGLDKGIEVSKTLERVNLKLHKCHESYTKANH